MAEISDVRLTREEVEQVLAQAVTHASRIDEDAVIAVVDREGVVLGVWDVTGEARPSDGVIAGAVCRAGAAAFLSSDQNAFTTRTAGFIIQQHFPPGVRNTGPGPLVGVGFSSLFFSDVNRFKKFSPDGTLSPPKGVTQSPGTRGEPVLFTSLSDSPGGVPLYKAGHLVGGVGVTGDGAPTNLAPAAAIFARQTQRDATTGFVPGYDTDEEVALAGQTKFRPSPDIIASNVLINGIRVPYVFPTQVEEIPDVRDVQDLGRIGKVVEGFEVRASPPRFPYPIARLGGVEGEIANKFIDDPDPRLIGAAGRLKKEDVKDIISFAAARANRTRAGIRLPIGTAVKVFITVVSNPARAGSPPVILGCFRVGEATMFSWDVSAQKARTAVFFSNRQLAMSSRSVGFLAQRFFPPGLDGRPYGPLFGFQEAVTLRLGKGAPPNANLPNGMTIFPGGFPLYRDGALVGAIGISGDGIDQDDIIGISGTKDFQPLRRITADNYTYRGARLPYVKFPRDPEQ